MTFGYGWGEYDNDVRYKKTLGRHPLTEKEEKDLELWNTIRFYEVLIKIKKFSGWCHYENGIWIFRKERR